MYAFHANDTVLGAFNAIEELTTADLSNCLVTFILFLLPLSGDLQRASSGFRRRISVCLEGTSPPPTLSGVFFFLHQRTCWDAFHLPSLLVPPMEAFQSLVRTCACVFFTFAATSSSVDEDSNFKFSKFSGEFRQRVSLPRGERMCRTQPWRRQGWLGTPGRLGRRMERKKEMHRATGLNTEGRGTRGWSRVWLWFPCKASEHAATMEFHACERKRTPCAYGRVSSNETGASLQPR